MKRDSWTYQDMSPRDPISNAIVRMMKETCSRLSLQHSQLSMPREQSDCANL